MIKMTVWALFDSGNGSYTKGVKTLNSSGGANIDIYPIGIDIENKNDHFINLNLAVCGLIEWYFTWVFSIFPIKPYLIPVLLVHSFLFGGLVFLVGSLVELIGKRKSKI